MRKPSERCLPVLWLTAKRTTPQLKIRLSSFAPITALALFCLLPRSAVASSCVWKVTGPGGGTIYLGGSVHALRSSGYPLPAAYNRAFDASSRVVFEDDPKAASKEAKELLRSGTYPKGDTLKNHVDPAHVRLHPPLLRPGERARDRIREVSPVAAQRDAFVSFV